jgi:L-rhamnose-H+ transport protein
MGLLALGALMSASYILPMRYAKLWNWEVIWLGYTVVALIIVPWLVIGVSIPTFRNIYASCTGKEIFIPVAFGLAWGAAVLLYGRGVAILGISLGNSIIIGIAATLGSGIPLVALHREKVFAREGLSILTGVVIMLLGVYFCCIAGCARDRQNAKSGTGEIGLRYGFAVVTCLLCGILAPMMTLGLAFGTPVMDRAVAMGVPTAGATYLIWGLVLPPGAVVSILYCLFLMKKNHSWSQFTRAGSLANWFLAMAMAILWFGGVVLFGVSTVYLGSLGVSIAQALFVIFMIIGANAIGVLTQEWKGVSSAAIRQLAVGITFLVLACAVITIGTS